MFYLCVYLKRAIDHTVTLFNLPTSYNVPGQDHIEDEDDKDKVDVDTKKTTANDYTTEQLEDIAKGWMRSIKKIMKSYQLKVIYIYIF